LARTLTLGFGLSFLISTSGVLPMVFKIELLIGSQISINSSATKAQSHKGYIIILVMPFLVRGTLKLIKIPRRLPASLK
jgi:hypothetical protein